jgi:uncharacterized protein (TIGR04255 family)
VGLNKPPLVEVWMSFRFEPAAGAPPWTRERYQTFFKAVADSHPKVEHMTQYKVRVTTSEGGKARIGDPVEYVLAMRAFTQDGIRAVQLTPDELVVNYLRGDTEPYPGFPALLEEALAHCHRYAECYQPAGVMEAALHYVDVIELPVPESRVVRTEDYLTLNFRVPEEVFGYFAAFEVKAVVRPPGASELVEMVFATLPGGPDDTHRRFRMEWHTPAKAGVRMDEDALRANLKTAHDRLESCFRHAFTAEGWALFEPYEEP